MNNRLILCVVVFLLVSPTAIATDIWKDAFYEATEVAMALVAGDEGVVVLDTLKAVELNCLQPNSVKSDSPWLLPRWLAGRL